MKRTNSPPKEKCEIVKKWYSKKNRQRSRSEKYGTNGNFLGKSDTALPFPIVLERSDDEFPLKICGQ